MHIYLWYGRIEKWSVSIKDQDNLFGCEMKCSLAPRVCIGNREPFFIVVTHSEMGKKGMNRVINIWM